MPNPEYLELHDQNSPNFWGGSSPGFAEPDYVVPGGMASAAGREVTPVRGDGNIRFESSRASRPTPGSSEHLRSVDIVIPTNDSGLATSTRAAESAHAYLKGSDRGGAYDNPNSIIPPETKVQADVDPAIRSLESVYGLNKGKKGPKI